MTNKPKVNLAFVETLPESPVKGTVYMSPDSAEGFLKVGVGDNETETIFDSSVYAKKSDSVWVAGEGANSAVLKDSNSHAIGTGAVAHGYDTSALGNYSHAEGESTTASGYASHAEGNDTTAFGQYSHAEGNSTFTYGQNSHAEGSGDITLINTTISGAAGSTMYTMKQLIILNTNTIVYYDITDTYAKIVNREGKILTLDKTLDSSNALIDASFYRIHGSASGDYSHAEGYSAIAGGTYSHAEGYSAIANGAYSHAEGYIATAYGDYSHAEGHGQASGAYSHAEGASAKAISNYSHAEGINTSARGTYSHAEGSSTITQGEYSHTEGDCTIASGTGSHAEGYDTTASGQYSHAEGRNTTAFGNYSHTEGEAPTFNIKISGAANTTTYTYNNDSQYLVIGVKIVYGSYEAIVTGINTSTRSFTVNKTLNEFAALNDVSVSIYGGSAYGRKSHIEGCGIVASGESSHAEGGWVIASGNYSHAEGSDYSTASGISSHAEGATTTASGTYSHAEGDYTTASGQASHAEGYFTKVSGIYSHVEGYFTQASGGNSHAEGYYTVASGDNSHAEGNNTITSNYNEHAQGEYNYSQSGTLFSIGIGSNSRKNIIEVNNKKLYINKVGGYTGTTINSSMNALDAVLNMPGFSDPEYDYIFNGGTIPEPSSEVVIPDNIHNYWIWLDKYQSMMFDIAVENGYDSIQSYMADFFDDPEGIPDRGYTDRYEYYDDIQFDGSTYQLWYDDNSDFYGILKQDSLQTMIDNSKETDLDNEYTPFLAMLNADMDIQYDKDEMATNRMTYEKSLITVKPINSATSDIKDYYLYISDYGDESGLLRYSYEWNYGGNISAYLDDELNEPDDFGAEAYYYDSDIEFDGETYQLWRDWNTDEMPMLLKSDTPEYMAMHSVEADYHNKYCPFVAMLNDDMDDIRYDDNNINMAEKYRLLCFRER